MAGNVQGTALVLSLLAIDFSASMYLHLDGCKQSISVRPRANEVERVAVWLRKAGCTDPPQ